MFRVYTRTFFYDKRPTWRPLKDGEQPVMAATIEAARAIAAAMRGTVYRLRHGEYAAPDFGVRGPDGQIRPLEP